MFESLSSVVLAAGSTFLAESPLSGISTALRPKIGNVWAQRVEFQRFDPSKIEDQTLTRLINFVADFIETRNGIADSLGTQPSIAQARAAYQQLKIERLRLMHQILSLPEAAQEITTILTDHHQGPISSFDEVRWQQLYYVGLLHYLARRGILLWFKAAQYMPSSNPAVKPEWSDAAEKAGLFRVTAVRRIVPVTHWGRTIMLDEVDIDDGLPSSGRWVRWPEDGSTTSTTMYGQAIYHRASLDEAALRRWRSILSDEAQRFARQYRHREWSLTEQGVPEDPLSFSLHKLESEEVDAARSASSYLDWFISAARAHEAEHAASDEHRREVLEATTWDAYYKVIAKVERMPTLGEARFVPEEFRKPEMAYLLNMYLLQPLDPGRRLALYQLFDAALTVIADHLSDFPMIIIEPHETVTIRSQIAGQLYKLPPLKLDLLWDRVRLQRPKTAKASQKSDGPIVGQVQDLYIGPIRHPHPYANFFRAPFLEWSSLQQLTALFMVAAFLTFAARAIRMFLKRKKMASIETAVHMAIPETWDNQKPDEQQKILELLYRMILSGHTQTTEIMRIFPEGWHITKQSANRIAAAISAFTRHKPTSGGSAIGRLLWYGLLLYPTQQGDQNRALSARAGLEAA